MLLMMMTAVVERTGDTENKVDQNDDFKRQVSPLVFDAICRVVILCVL
jgi:hypothetical protein